MKEKNAFLRLPTTMLTRMSISAHLSYHRNICALLVEGGLDQREETAETLAHYRQLIEAQTEFVAYHRARLTTPEVQDAAQRCQSDYIYIISTLRNLKNRSEAPSKERLSFLRQELRPYTVRLARSAEPKRLTTYRSLLGTLSEKFQDEVRLCQLESTIADFSASIETLQNASLKRIDESQELFRGGGQRLRNEIDHDYRLLIAYVEAWGNSHSSRNAALQQHFDRMHQILLRCQQLGLHGDAED